MISKLKFQSLKLFLSVVILVNILIDINKHVNHQHYTSWWPNDGLNQIDQSVSANVTKWWRMKLHLFELFIADVHSWIIFRSQCDRQRDDSKNFTTETKFVFIENYEKTFSLSLSVDWCARSYVDCGNFSHLTSALSPNYVIFVSSQVQFSHRKVANDGKRWINFVANRKIII